MRILTAILIIFNVLNYSFSQTNISLNYGYGSNDNKAKSNVFNSNGSQFICGEFSGEFIQGFNYINEPKKSIFLLKENTIGDVQWMLSFKSTASVNVNSIATKDNVIAIAGMFSDSLIIFNDTIKCNGQKSMYIAFFDTLGTYQYVYVPNSHSSEIFDLTISDNNVLYATGEFYQNLSIDSFTENSPLGFNMFVFPYDLISKSSDWLKVSNGNATNGKSITLDDNHNVIVVGSYGNATTFSGEVLPNVSGDHNLYIAKYKSNGDLNWIKAITGTVQTHGLGVKTNHHGDIYFTGEFEMILDLPNQISMNAVGTMDAVIGKLDSNGVFLWAKQFGSVDIDKGIDILLDTIGNPIFLLNGGQFQNIDGLNISTNGFKEPLIVKLNQQNGVIVWTKRLNGLSPAGIVEGLSIAKFKDKITICGTNRTGIHYGSDIVDSPNLDDVFWFSFKDTICPITNLSVMNLETDNFNLFPNPTKEKVTIQANSKISSIEIYNLLGELILTQPLNDYEVTINLSQINNLKTGTYLIKLITNESNYKTKLVNYEH